MKSMYPRTVNTPRPNSHTYWVHEHFLAGEYPGAPDEREARDRLRAYLDTGVNFFVDLTRPGEMRPYEDLLRRETVGCGIQAEYRRLAIPDMGVPTRQTMLTVLDTIDLAVSAGRLVYVHCWGGVGRTGTVVGCYLVRHGHTGDDALAEIARIWPTVGKVAWHPRSPETSEQVRFVREWWEEPAGG
jgi:hypothetical protein